MVAPKGALGTCFNLGAIVDSQLLERNVAKNMTDISESSLGLLFHFQRRKWLKRKTEEEKIK